MNSLTASAARLRAAAALAFLSASLTLSPAALAQANGLPPERMTYQGFLVDGNGAPLGGSGAKNYDVIFRIYSDSTGGTLKWSEQQTVTVDKGYFSVLLGEGAQVSSEAHPALSTLFKGGDASDRYVAITVKGIGPGGGNVDINPRLRLLTSPYAYLAAQANKLVRADNNADLLTSTENVLALNGHLDLVGPSSLEFGVGNAKEANNGRIGYQLFSSGLDIVGAGADVANRRITFHAQGGSTFNGPVTAPLFNGAYAGDGSGLTGVAKLGANIFTGYQEIQNHLRIGEVSTTSGAAGWGEALVFSGAPPLMAGYNGDNSDPLWMARYNSSANTSELRMVIGDDPGGGGGGGADRFVIGTMQGDGNFSQTATWAPQFAFRANGLLEFRPGINKEVSAGTIGYQVHSGDSLDIVGAGTSGANRKVQVWAEGSMQVNSGVNGLVVNTQYGETFRAYANVMRVMHYTDKNRFFYMWRADNGVGIYATGGGFGNGGGNYDRQITWDGDGNWDVASDRKLKKDIVDAEPMLERALQVQVRRFRWKDAQEDSKPSLGVIAQELQPLFPELVSEQENNQTKEKNLAVGYSDFGLIAVKALQEMKVQHDAEVSDLKAQIADLKAQMKQVLQAAAEIKASADNSRTTAAVTK